MSKHKGIVACGHPVTANAAAAILEEGGNAFDAALAAMCAACVAEPVLASLGGGGFLLARPTGGRFANRPIVFDFFPQTPKSRRPSDEIEFYPVLADFGPAQQEFHIGMGAIATPGAVRGLFEVHRHVCRLPLRRIVQPAVDLARTGVAMNPLQAYFLAIVAPIFRSTTESEAVFASPERPGALIGEGEALRLRRFADALEVLAIEGDDLFYRGEIAQAISADSRARGGHLTADDLADYAVALREPLTAEAFSCRLLLNPPPSNGGLLIAFSLELLRDAQLSGSAFGSEAHVDSLVRVMAATNRARLEQALHRLPAKAAAEAFLSPALVDAYRNHLLGRPWATRGTTHISVIDAAGNAAALSLTNGEGSGYIVPNTDIMLNNVLGEEDINPHGVHAWPRDARLSSMLAPTIALGRDGSLTVLGSGGSNRLRTAILQVLLNLLAFELPVEQAVTAPRIHLEAETLSVEPGFSEGAAALLRRHFADVALWNEHNMFFGGVHTVRMERSGAMIGAGDPRRGGIAHLV